MLHIFGSIYIIFIIVIRLLSLILNTKDLNKYFFIKKTVKKS